MNLFETKTHLFKNLQKKFNSMLIAVIKQSVHHLNNVVPLRMEVNLITLVLKSKKKKYEPVSSSSSIHVVIGTAFSIKFL